MEVFGVGTKGGLAGSRPFTFERRFQPGTNGLEINCWASPTLPTDLNKMLTEVPLSHFTDRETEACRFAYSPKISEVLQVGKQRNKKESTGCVILGKLVSVCSVSPSREWE